MVVRATGPGLLGTPRPIEEGLRLASAPQFEFDAVYAAQVHFVWRVLRGMGVSDALVEDAVQDVFVVVHRRLPEFDGRFSIRTWLFEIAFRVGCEYRRKGKRAASLEPLDEGLRDSGPSPAEQAERNHALHVAEELLDELEDDKRALLVLSEIEGMTGPEIAVVMGTPLNTVYSRLRRARKQLSEALAERQQRMK
jgi:RNA polymerase sigma-70 factor (ECF subfamily)